MDPFGPHGGGGPFGGNPYARKHKKKKRASIF